jgi:hypothetical protein
LAEPFENEEIYTIKKENENIYLIPRKEHKFTFIWVKIVKIVLDAWFMWQSFELFSFI